jgi:hypothetical protein
MLRSLHNVWPGIDHVKSQIKGTAAERDIDAVRVEVVGDGDGQLLQRRIRSNSLLDHRRVSG